MPADLTPRIRLVIGVMTGTSMDGLDAALVSIRGSGRSLEASLVRQHAARFPEPLAAQLRRAANQTPMSAGAFAQLAYDFGAFHADALRPLVASERGRPIDLVVAHGQTVYHAPPLSWQLLNAAPIVAALGCPVVCDLRQADLLAGGQGAPITPLADWIIFRAERDRAVVNLGGFCNATLLRGSAGPEGVRGTDVCACNQVLDAVARHVLNAEFDVDGAAAARGTLDNLATHELRALLDAQRTSRRSLGTGDEAGAWIDAHCTRLRADDLAASAVAAIAETIAAALWDAGLSESAEVLLAGGGANNAALVAAIAQSTKRLTRTLDAVGIPIEARESMEMAVLGALAADGVPISLPAVTHRGTTVVREGAWSFPSLPQALCTHDLHAALAKPGGTTLP
ncbi:MAG: anhydro-N-acetylmuramic acid kinase [Phycisphaerae bacterium]|nr:anhydro-N-acetylmuramic acid kinase [Phycisphaerae bacterium]